MPDLRIWLEATRPKTLPAAVCPVLVGTSLAYHNAQFNWHPALICLGFALLIQIGTNFANDYLDGIKGTDTAARIGPRRAVASGLIPAIVMKRAAILVLAVGFCLGLSLISYGGWWLLLIGIASVACAWLYTGGPYPLAYNGLGDVFVVLFFGLIAVGCTYYVQAGSVSADAMLLGLSCGLLINNILVVNNFRDVEEDVQAGKRTLVVVFGRRFARFQYLGSTLIATGVTAWLLFSGYGLLISLSLAPLAVSFALGLRLNRLVEPSDYLKALKGAGLVVASYGLLLSVGIAL